ncbi:MAG TPA: FtsQ-type POTRA domain-containing protein [Oligoflexia bacterium]|nr:FtsQ-type POTRA domain-containing protein [Oligoflexia bacterium]HMP26583.1 FtsQ-type POTRA domain-containing protein [Oligoflexia bacterium]
MKKTFIRSILLILLVGLSVAPFFLCVENLSFVLNRFREWRGKSYYFIESQLFERRLQFSGLQRLTEKELIASLPHDHSNLWWFMNRRHVIKELRKNNWIASASLSTCSRPFEPVCFMIEIKEREPRYVALSEKGSWALDSQGEIIGPLKENQINQTELTVIEGAFKGSPGLFEKNLSVALKLLSVLREQGLPEPSRVLVGDEDQYQLAFPGNSYIVNFSGAQPSYQNFSKQGERLKIILSQVQSDLAKIREIDLAFDKLGIVKFVDTEERLIAKSS